MMVMIKNKTFYPLDLWTRHLSWRYSEVPRLGLAVGWALVGQTRPASLSFLPLGPTRQIFIFTVEVETICAFKKVAFLNFRFVIYEVCY